MSLYCEDGGAAMMDNMNMYGHSKYKRCRTGERDDNDALNAAAAAAMNSTGQIGINPPSNCCLSVAEQFLQLELNQCHELDAIQFTDPVCYVYNPLTYAGHPHSAYVRTYCQGPKYCLFVGMNPGPFGMAQTGVTAAAWISSTCPFISLSSSSRYFLVVATVPFGQISVVKEWLRIDGLVGKPDREHPRRQILGFDCKRNEISGQRFWSLFREMSGTPEVFFRHCFVHNYCPLMFMGKTGKNVTPPQIALAERRRLQAVCDAYVCRTIRLLDVRLVVAVGRYTYDRIVDALKADNMLDSVRVAFIMHPSPINPMANKGWAGIVRKKLEELDVIRFLCST